MYSAGRVGAARLTRGWGRGAGAGCGCGMVQGMVLYWGSCEGTPQPKEFVLGTWCCRGGLHGGEEHLPCFGSSAFILMH